MSEGVSQSELLTAAKLRMSPTPPPCVPVKVAAPCADIHMGGRSPHARDQGAAEQSQSLLCDFLFLHCRDLLSEGHDVVGVLLLCLIQNLAGRLPDDACRHLLNEGRWLHQ